MDTNPEKHKGYRESGNALVAILITLSSGLLLWNINLLDRMTEEVVFVVVAIFFLILCIIASLFALLSHFKGYQSEARSNDNMPTTPEATEWFDRADWLVPGALYGFLIGALLDIVLLITLRT